jgi:hypothetical protein
MQHSTQLHAMMACKHVTHDTFKSRRSEGAGPFLHDEPVMSNSGMAAYTLLGRPTEFCLH